MKALTELEAAYVRVFEHTRQKIIEEIGAQSSHWRPNGPATDTIVCVQRVIRAMPTPEPKPPVEVMP